MADREMTEEEQHTPEGQEGLPEGGEGTDGMEPYGAQVWRRVHQDFSVLMEEYDEMVRLCEHEHVNAHLKDILESFGEHLDHIEQSMGEHYSELPPIEGAMTPQEEEGAEEEEEFEDEEAKEEHEGEEEETKGELPDEKAEEADSEEDDDVASPKEAVENMKALHRRVKTIRRQVKGLPEKGKTYRKKKKSHNYEDVPGEEEHQEKPGHTGTPDPDNPDLNYGFEEGHDPGFEEDQEHPGEEVGEEGLAHGIKSHHLPHVRDAQGFLKSLPEIGHDWTDEHRMESYHHHKSLCGIADEMEGQDQEVELNAPGMKKLEHQKEPISPKKARRLKQPKGSNKQPKGSNEKDTKRKRRYSEIADRAGRPFLRYGHQGHMTPKDKTGEDIKKKDMPDGQGMGGGMDMKGMCSKSLRNVGNFFKELSTHHTSLTDDHLKRAMEHHQELNPLLHEVEEGMDLPQGKEEVDVEVGDMGEKHLYDTMEKQQQELRKLAHQLNGLSTTLNF